MTPKDKQTLMITLNHYYPKYYHRLKKRSGGSLIGNYITGLYKQRGYNSYQEIKDSCPSDVRVYKHVKNILREGKMKEYLIKYELETGLFYVFDLDTDKMIIHDHESLTDFMLTTDEGTKFIIGDKNL